MASQLKVDSITGVTTAGSVSVQGEGSATTNLQQGLAKGWCNFEQASTHSIRDSLNIASLTDNGTGETDTSYTNNYANANYVAGGHSGRQGNTSESAYWIFPTEKGGDKHYSTSQVSWVGGYSISTSSGLQQVDMYLCLCTIHGDLA